MLLEPPRPVPVSWSARGAGLTRPAHGRSAVTNHTGIRPTGGSDAAAWMHGLDLRRPMSNAARTTSVMCVYNTAAKHLYSTRQNWAQARWLNGQYSVVCIGIYSGSADSF